MRAVAQRRIAYASARRQGFARCARRLKPPLTATAAQAQQVIKQSFDATASLINHWLKHEIPDNSPIGGGSRPQGLRPSSNAQPAMHLAPRCGARTRRGSPCQAPAMPNGRCRMHGGTSTGAPKGNKNAFKHGFYTADAIARRREISELVRTMKALARGIE